MIEFDLAADGLRALNRRLQGLGEQSNETEWRVLHPSGEHALAVGLTRPLKVVVEGHAGFYCGGMNSQAEIEIRGHAGPGVAENMMSGIVRVTGNASQSAGASGHGGLLVIEGDASSRCGISMKGVDIVVQRLGRPHERVHGTGRSSGGGRRCRPRSRRFDLRGACSTCAARWRKPRLRLHRETEMTR